MFLGMYVHVRAAVSPLRRSLRADSSQDVCLVTTIPSSSSSPIQRLVHWPVPASMNSTFCVVYQDLFFLWACTKEPASALVLLPSSPRVQANLVYIFLFCH
jgi:hypothetical protein